MWARASALDRHLQCPAASWFPRGDRGKWAPGYLAQLGTGSVDGGIPAPGGSVLAQWGTEMHLAKAGDPAAADPWLTLMDPHRDRLWPASLGRHEVAFAYDCRTGKVRRGPAVGGDAWKEASGPSEVTGSCDWLGEIPSGEAWVDDLKTGWPVPAVYSNQMKFYAMCAVRCSGMRQGCRLSVTHWRRGTTEPVRLWGQLGAAAVDKFEEQLVAAWRAAAAGPRTSVGPWCRWCQSAPVCPAVNGTEDECLIQAKNE